jgi:hypothetical protein
MHAPVTVFTHTRTHIHHIADGHGCCPGVQSIKHYEDVWRSGGIAPYFLTAALDGVEKLPSNDSGNSSRGNDLSLPNDYETDCHHAEERENVAMSGTEPQPPSL